MRVRAVWLSVLLTLSAVLCCAQVDRGKITGIVTDATGAVVPNAKVIVTNVLTGVNTASATDSAGVYVVPALPFGTYQVTFQAQGFADLVQTGIELSISSVRNVNATLRPGSLQQTIEVHAGINDLRTATPEVSTSVDTSTLAKLPMLAMNGARHPEAWAYKTSPSAIGDNWTDYIAGGTEGGKEVLLDGASVTTNRGGAFGENAPSVEALQEVKLQTFGYSAEFGRFQSGLFSMEMKSGTNEWHGSGYGQLNNEAFDANTWTSNASGIARGRDRQWDVAGSFGGPVKIPHFYDGKNRTFFYFTTEKHRLKQGVLGGYNYTNPTEAFYKGDFSSVIQNKTGTDTNGNVVAYGTIYDPATAAQLANGTWIATPFIGNQIPLSRFSKVAQNLNAIMQKYYLPTVTDAATGQVRYQNNAQFLTNGTPRWDQVNYSIKLDHALTDAQRLSVSYSRVQRPRFLVSGSNNNKLWNPNVTDGGPLASTQNLTVNTDQARINHDWAISPTLLSHFTVFLNRCFTSNLTTASGVDGMAALGITGATAIGYPVVNWVGGVTPISNNPGDNVNAFYVDQSAGLVETVTKITGRHEIKMGVDYRRYVENLTSGATEQFNFNAATTSIPNSSLAGTYMGSAFASYLLGDVYNISFNPASSSGGRRRYTAAFIQDTYKLTHNLTLNIGLRWEYNSPHEEVNNMMDSWDPTRTDPATGLPGAYVKAGDCGQNCIGRSYFGKRDFKDFGPRVGLAWHPFSTWTMRAAYALMYEGDPFNGVYGSPNGTSTQNAWGGTYSSSAAATNPWAGLFNWDNGVPSSLYTPTQFNPSWGNKNSPTMIDPRYGTAPYIQNWNVNIQHELPGRIVLDAGYEGMKGTRLRDSELYNLNQISIANVYKYEALLGNTVASAADAAKYGAAYPYAGFVGTLAQALKPYPNVSGNITDWGSPNGFLTYNAMLIQATKRPTHGVFFNVSFNWEKSLGNVESSIPGSNRQAMDTYNTALEKTLTQMNVPTSLRGWVGYELPVGKGRKFLGNTNQFVDAVLGGWSANEMFTYERGRRTGVGRQGSISSYYNGYRNRLNIAAGQMALDNVDANSFNYAAPSQNPVTINTSLITVPASGTMGTSAIAQEWDTGKPMYNEDLSLAKSFNFKERFNLMLRLESFNLLNRHQISGLDTWPLDANFGRWTSISSSQLPRSAQVSMRLIF